ncbi:MAG: DUF2214 family protein [Cyclobacteriaceae bacterium]
MAFIIIKYLHYLSIITMVASVVGELVLLKPKMIRKEMKLLAKLDALYGVMAILVVGLGLTLWFGVGKSAEYYSKNWILHTKVGLFVVIGALSLIPTIFIAKNRKGDDHDVIEIPSKIKLIVTVELLIFAIIPLLAVLMANGFGFTG